MTFFRLNRNAIFFVAILFCCAVNAFAKLSFSSLNLNEENEVLFALTHKVPGSIEYSTIFKTKIKNGQAEYFPHALTCFPERMESFAGGQKILVKNRYGSAIYDFNSKTLQWIERSENFPENYANPMPVALSSTGNWYCSLERTDMFKGRLVITEIATGKKIVLSEDCSFSYSSIPVKWSPNGENFIYEKNGAVYLCNAQKLFRDILLQEEFRKVCSGSIDSIVWNTDAFLIYISSDLVFRIEPKEIFSFGVYSKFIPLGKILGRLPQKFDSVCDKFWVNSNGTEFCVVHNSELICWYKTNFSVQDDMFVKTLYTAPFIEPNMSAFSFDVFWTGAGNLVVVAKLVRSGNGEENYAIYTIDGKNHDKLNRQLFIENTYSNVSMSPDKMHVAFLAGDDVLVYKVSSWKPVCQLKGEKAFSLEWCDEKTLCIGGLNSVKRLSLLDFSVKALFASSANSAWWTQDGYIAFKDASKNTYTLNELNGLWSKESVEEDSAVVQNEKYRIFCGTTKNELYENALYVRTLAGKITTRALVQKTALPTPPRKKIALIFDADEDTYGLSSVLAVCNEYNLKCTIFFNGEFIRRYPSETKRVADSGHECAAIFFNNINLMDKAVYGDKRFVSKGLARLEDEFFSCTGKELSLYWHAPYNSADKKVREEGSAAGYTYIDQNEPCIISLGLDGGKKLSDAALYNKFNLLINELFATGVEFVTVSGLN